MRLTRILRMNRWSIVVCALAALAIVVASCGQSTPTPTPLPAATPTRAATATATPASQATATPTKAPTAAPTLSNVSLTGAGATFPYPLYSKWFDEYAKLTGVKVNYQSIGSGGGIKQITEGTVDFGASDGIMTDAQITAAEAARGPILHIPATIGAVAVIHNVAGIASGQLKLTPEVLADIYLKNIKKWNDPAITATNPRVNLPNADIAVVHRSDGSGTTYIFTNYLAKVSQEWSTRVGNATSVEWPGDIGGKGNEGVAGQVQQIPNTIGYVELAYAEQNKLAWAKLRNKAGNYMEPSIQAASKAAEGVALPDDMKVMITDSANPDAYPITGFTWLLVYKNQTDRTKGEAVARMIWWAIHDGQEFGEPLDYAPLPADAVKKAENQVLSINYNGQPLITG